MLEKISFMEFLEKLLKMLLEYSENKNKTIMDLVDKFSELNDNYKAGNHNEINHITRELGLKNKPFSPDNGKKSLTCHYCKKVDTSKQNVEKSKLTGNDKAMRQAK
jgi:hypothetical protein